MPPYVTVNGQEIELMSWPAVSYRRYLHYYVDIDLNAFITALHGAYSIRYNTRLEADVVYVIVADGPHSKYRYKMSRHQWRLFLASHNLRALFSAAPNTDIWAGPPPTLPPIRHTTRVRWIEEGF